MKKYDDIEYNLELNAKNAPGGLRDLQTISVGRETFFYSQYAATT